MEENKERYYINIFQNISPSHQFLVWLKIKFLVLKVELRTGFFPPLIGSL